jgi:hypothetical protein
VFDNFIEQIRGTGVNNEIKIYLEEVNDFDPSFVGWLFLFAVESDQKIVLEFKTQSNYSKYYQLLHLLSLVDKYHPNTITVRCKGYKKRQDSSREFFPIIPVTSDTHKALYRTSFSDFLVKIQPVMSSVNFWKHFKGNKNKGDDIFKFIMAFVRNIALEKEDQPLRVIFSYYLRLINDLRFIKRFAEILTHDLPEQFRITDQAVRSGIPGFKRENATEYWDDVQRFLDDRVCSKPPFFVLIFCLMALNYRVNPVFSTTNNSDLLKLYLLAYEYFTRIAELVNNIIEHSSNRSGVVIGRVFEKRQIRELFPAAYNKFDAKEFIDTSHYLNLTVMDCSREGIISTAIKTWSELDKEKFKEDIHSLQSEGSLKKFFDTRAIHFQHQTVRTCACLGLLIFSELIMKNRGYFKVITKDAQSRNGIVFDTVTMNDTIASTNFNGTKYDVLLPIDITRSWPLSLHDELFPVPLAKNVVDALAHGEFILLNRGQRPENLSPQVKTVIWDTTIKPEFKLEKKRFQEREEADRIVGEYERYTMHGKRVILAINCRDLMAENVSNLFRIIAHIQLRHSHKAIIVYDLAEEVGSAFVGILIKYITAGFWSDSHFILLLNNLAEPFFIGGSKIEEWWSLNRFLIRTCGACRHLVDMVEKILPGNTAEDEDKTLKRLAAGNPLFICDERENTCGLLPTELFLKFSDGLTLFEQRVYKLLNTSIGEKNIL